MNGTSATGLREPVYATVRARGSELEIGGPSTADGRRSCQGIKVNAGRGARPGELASASSDHTRWVQQSLNRIMGLRLAVDGTIGPQTRSAIRSFQSRSGLSPDGIPGPRTDAALVASGAGAPPAAGPWTSPAAPRVEPRPLGAPALIGRECAPPAVTLYAAIDLSIRDGVGRQLAQPVTGIFVPQGYEALPTVDLVIYLHGHTGRFGPLTIDSYWDRSRFSFRPLREGVNESRKNVVLVAPTLGPGSQTGRLTRAGGLDFFLDQVVAALGAYGPYRGQVQPVIGNLILACHSGGGWPMRQLALGRDRYTANIRECWGFDCTYNRGDDSAWAAWARARQSSRVYIYYLRNTRTQILSARLQQMGVPNAIVQASNARGHEWVPVTHWLERLRAAPFLRQIGATP